MGKNEVTEFLSYLASEKRVSASTQNQALDAFLFLYRNKFNWGESANFKGIADNQVQCFVTSL